FMFQDVEQLADGTFKVKEEVRERNERLRINVENAIQKIFDEAEAISLGNSGYEIEGDNLWQAFQIIKSNPLELLDPETGEPIFTAEDFETEITRMDELMDTFYADLVDIVGRRPNRQ